MKQSNTFKIRSSVNCNASMLRNTWKVLSTVESASNFKSETAKKCEVFFSFFLPLVHPGLAANLDVPTAFNMRLRADYEKGNL
jgi:hypothetical protein